MNEDRNLYIIPDDQDSYYLVDSGEDGTEAIHWLYNAVADRWYCFDSQELEDGDLAHGVGSLFIGLDEGAHGVINRYGLAPVDDTFETSGPEPGYAPMKLEHKTSREYAKALRSAKLGAEDMMVLWAACHGQEVDAYTFRTAVSAALRVAVTRKGKRWTDNYREIRARQAAHLLHIADAVIENHRRGLPAMDPGERSPALAAEKERTLALIKEKTELEIKLEDQAAELARLAEVERVAQVRDEVLADAQRELDAAVARADEGWAKAVDEQDRANAAEALAASRQEELEAYYVRLKDLGDLVVRLRKERDAAQLTLEYAQRLFQEAEAPEFAGRVDGYRQALLDQE